jgi:hypothetical protein
MEDQEWKKGVNLRVYRFSAEDKDWMSMVYRATDSIEDANAVMVPFIRARKMMAQKVKEGYEFSLTPKDKVIIGLCESAGRSRFRRIFMKPAESDWKRFKEIHDKRAELDARLANPLMDLEKADGEAMLKAMIEQLAAKNFTLKSRESSSNGEFHQENIHLAKA